MGAMPKVWDSRKKHLPAPPLATKHSSPVPQGFVCLEPGSCSNVPAELCGLFYVLWTVASGREHPVPPLRLEGRIQLLKILSTGI